MLAAMCLLPTTGTLLSLVGFRRCLALFNGICGRSDRSDPSLPPEAIAWCVAAAANHGLYAGNCLKRSMTLWFLLRRRGIPAELRIGSRITKGKFEAHAWVQSGEAVLNDNQAGAYAAFDGDLLGVRSAALNL